jgi:hypothetical protein
MNRFRSIAGSFAASLMLLVGLAAWHDDARALGFNDLVTVLSQMDKYNVNPFPVKGSELQGAKGLFDCLAGGSDVLGCLDTHKDDDFVKKYGGVNLELPPWMDNLVSAYVAIQNNDFWGVVGPLGEAAVCVIAQVMAAGLDLCGLIKDLIAVGEALLDAATAVGQFFADVGGGFYDAVACGIFGDCGSGPPPEQVAYTCVFAPKVKPDGLNAIEAVDGMAFSKLREDLTKQAMKAAPCAAQPLTGYPGVSAGAAAKAADIFDNAVRGVWTGDIQSRVLLERDKKRIEYNTPAQISALAQAAVQKVATVAGVSDVKALIVNQCSGDFGTKFAFAHIDRWLAWRQAGQTEAQKKAQQLANVTSDRSWCETDLWSKNLDKFAQALRSYLLANGCPAFGQQMTCTTVAKFDICSTLMKSVNQEAQCHANVAAIGKELAAKINAYFQEQHSKFAPCNVVLPDGGAPVSNKPVDFVCKRPTQQHFCGKKYKELWKHAAFNPLNCAPPQLEPAYAAQIEKVKQAAAQLQAKYPSVGVDPIDPLIVHAGKPDVFAALKQAAPTSPQRASPNTVSFDYRVVLGLTIDGVSRPTLVGDMKVEPIMAGMPQAVGQAIAGVKPGDPDPLAKPGVSAAQPASSAQLAPSAAAIVGAMPGAPVSGQQAKVLSGPAPSSPGGRSTMAPVTAAPAPSIASSLQAGSQLPAVQSPTNSRLPAVQAPANSQLPAVQAPATRSTAPTVPGAAPNWGALGNQGGSPQPPSAPSTRSTTTSAATRAVLDPATERALAAASCTRTPGVNGLRFSCASRAGLERCETLRRQSKVEQCTLRERR